MSYFVARYNADMAPSYVPHVKLQYGGTLGDPPLEVWSNSLRWHCQGFVPTEPQLQAACDALVGPLSAWMQTTDSRVTSVAKLTYVKLNWVLENGKQREQNTVQADVVPAVGGGSGSNIPPWYQTQAITFRTRLKRGRGHSGRVFPPATSFVPEGSSPYSTQATALAMATAYRDLIVGLRTAMGTAFGGASVPDLAVFSVGSTTAPVVAPLWTPVIATVVDRVPDVQHRRTKQVPRSEGPTVVLDA